MIENRDVLGGTTARDLALDCIEAGVEAGRPQTVLAETVSVADGTLVIEGSEYDLGAYDEVVVLGGGNAAGAVAAELESILGASLDRGAVVTDDPYPTTRVECLPGNHPTPDEAGVESTRRVLDLADAATADTLVLGIVTGGGSALLAAPAEGISLADLQATTEALLASGATIHEINAVRKHLSACKGGRLAERAAPATVATLVFSDVVGNDLDVIASGPTAPDTSTFADALDVLAAYDVDVPAAVRDRLERGRRGDLPETPGPDHEAFDRVTNHVLVENFDALAAARDVAATRGYEPLVLSSRVRGEAREAGLFHAAVAEECLATGNPVEPPAVLLSGGETTVTIRGDGIGGPNQEFALQAGLELRGREIVVAGVDTDGIDGATDVAGALLTGETVADAAAARAALADNDVYPYLDERGAVVRTGPTGTNINDLRIVVVA